MATRILAVSTALLAVLVIHEYSMIGELRSQVVAAQARAAGNARSAVIASLSGQGAEYQRAIAWLDGYYRSPEGLRRPDGLWIAGHPDYEAIGAWIFDVYLQRRLQGDSEEQARQAVVAEIQQTDEWRAKHRS